MAEYDLNSDIGEILTREGEILDAFLMGTISSANVACGGHVGNHQSMRRVCRLARENNVAVGAQPSYPDRHNFGREVLDISSADLSHSLAEQMDALHSAAYDEQVTVTYVKPHGALYNEAIINPKVAAIIVNTIIRETPGGQKPLPVLTMSHGQLADHARAAGIPVIGEMFLDRGYQPDGTLVPRTHPEALILNPARIADRVSLFLRNNTVTAVDGTLLHVDATSLCVHSDTPRALSLVRTAAETILNSGPKVGTRPPQ